MATLKIRFFPSPRSLSLLVAVVGCSVILLNQSLKSYFLTDGHDWAEISGMPGTNKSPSLCQRPLGASWGVPSALVKAVSSSDSAFSFCLCGPPRSARAENWSLLVVFQICVCITHTCSIHKPRVYWNFPKSLWTSFPSAFPFKCFD